VAGERFWNVKHPAAYAQRLAAGDSPRQDGETIDEDTAHLERVMLQTRLRDGLPLAELHPAGRAVVPALVDRGLVVADDERLTLSLQGRLLADAVVRDLVD
jgi:oxygen-independent coproporphyrinogen-3 oxidase